MKANESRFATSFAEKRLDLIGGIAPSCWSEFMGVFAPEFGVAVGCVAVVAAICTFLQQNVVA